MATSCQSTRIPAPVSRVEGTWGSRLSSSRRGVSVPNTIHEKAYHLLRLLVANHPFVDGNKRTALNAVVVFYLLNGYRFDYDDEIRDILKRFGTDERTVSEEQIVNYLQTNTEDIDLAEEINQWRDELVRHGLGQLTDESSDPND